MSIKCISHYERGVDAAAHDDIMGAVLDKLLVTDGTSDALTAEINATSTGEDFTVQDVVLKDRTNSIQEHSLVTEQKLEMYIIPSR
jgi:hypothetical protein